MLKRRHNQKIDSKADQNTEGHDDKQVNEAAGSQSDEQHDDQCENDRDREGKNDKNIVIHKRTDLLGRSSSGCSDVGLKGI